VDAALGEGTSKKEANNEKMSLLFLSESYAQQTQVEIVRERDHDAFFGGVFVRFQLTHFPRSTLNCTHVSINLTF
jgi:hypothetical protein